jgi:HTH-type transcriptional regulator/antitoxin HigA
MARIKDENQYQIILKRVEALMDVVKEDTPRDNPDFVELDLLADLAEEYEVAHYPVDQPAKGYTIFWLRKSTKKQRKRFSTPHIKTFFMVCAWK